MDGDLKLQSLHYKPVLDYWKSLCDDTRIPTVSQFDPIAIPSILKDITIWEMTTDNEILCRLAGTAVVSRMNIDITGAELSKIIAPKAKHLMTQDFQNTLCYKCGIWYEVINKHPTGKIVLVDTMILPLYPDEGSRPKFVAVHNQSEVIEYQIDEAKLELARGFKDRHYIDLGWGVPAIQSEDIA